MRHEYSITNKARRRRDSGAMLLAVLFMMAIMVITALAVAPAFIQQAKRDREEEMIHRGTEYARAIKKYYKKFGQYPANLEQLEKTNNMRFLRRRYKDPLAKDGQWRLLHAADVASLVGAQGLAIPGAQRGQAAGALGPSLGQGSANAGASQLGQLANTAPAGAQLSQQQQVAILANQVGAAAQQSGGTSPFGATGTGTAGVGTSGSQATSGTGTTPSSGSGGGQDSNPQPGQTGSNNTIFGNTGVGGQTFGGGAIVGVASKSKDPTIRIYNKKKNYDEWQFIYMPTLDRANTLLRGPYNGETMMATGQFGSAPGQPIQGQQPGASGLQPLQGNPLQNQQQPQQLQPPTQFPPDQRQPQPQ